MLSRWQARVCSVRFGQSCTSVEDPITWGEVASSALPCHGVGSGRPAGAMWQHLVTKKVLG